MITEQQIKELAHSIWEQEGRPHGKDLEHYFRARKILEDMAPPRVIELPSPLPEVELKPSPASPELTAPTPSIELAPPAPRKRRSSRKK
jgi:hypothetical protein